MSEIVSGEAGFVQFTGKSGKRRNREQRRRACCALTVAVAKRRNLEQPKRAQHVVPLRRWRERWESGQVFLERLPVVLLPALVEVIVIAFGETGVIEDDECAGALRFEFKFHDGVDAGIPMRGAKGLHDALIGWEFYIAPFDETAKGGKGAA